MSLSAARGGSQRMEYGSCTYARMLLIIELALSRGQLTREGFNPLCPKCGQVIVDGCDMHDAIINRAAWRGLPENLIMVRENCVLVHPGGKNFGFCHLAAHIAQGREKCVKQLLQYEGYETVMTWLESLRGMAVSVVVEAVRLVEGIGSG